MDFSERLRRAAEHAGVPFEQTKIARSLGLSRQTVFQWFHGTTPESTKIAHVARTWNVDPAWLATGDGEMVPKPSASGLSNDERDIIKFYRNAQPQRRRALYDMAKALGKTAVAVAFTIPPLLPSNSEAAFNIKYIVATARQVVDYNTHWLRIRRWVAKIQDFLTGFLHASHFFARPS